MINWSNPLNYLTTLLNAAIASNVGLAVFDILSGSKQMVHENVSYVDETLATIFWFRHFDVKSFDRNMTFSDWKVD